MKRLLQVGGLVLATLAPVATALASYAPLSSSGPRYSIGIPSGSAISESTRGSMYLSITAPTSYRWVGVGTGRQMSGSQMFVLYADGVGNVTVSGRRAQGHSPPQLDTSLMAGVTVLEGSGVENGVMTAYIHCTTCVLSSAASSSSSPWITAWSEGSSINSNSLSYSIDRHDGDAYRQFSFDLTKSTLASDSNPFVESSQNPSSSRTPLNPTGNSSPRPTAGSSSDDDNDDSNSNSSSMDFTPDFKKIEQYLKGHGIIMGVTVVLLFPLGSIFMRTVRHPWIHAGIQIFSMIAMIAGLVLGIRLANLTSMLFNNSHSIFGIVIVALFLIQPILGLIHHRLYTKTQSRSIFSHLHIWYGRILMILAVLNGGLGLKLAANSQAGNIAYGVLAGFMALLYTIVVILKRRGNGGEGGRKFGMFANRDKDAGPRDGSS